ncbi:coiled-coil domain-containing protein 66 isoform X5 [Podarcis raffonei]|uniref:coiled-coil domain-containing protein 66 isoform X5 n=1 Tax=Podarcis raffonei TaxID=65483 RepID=UPI0023294C71|nr:coiled-coil domain-containing protein 66 isoform X5 [Podarcis raffonei]
MNLGDGLKLETEILDGKPRLIVAPCVSKSKPSVKICNKNKTFKHTLRTKQNGHILKSLHTSCEKSECFTKQKVGSRLSLTKDGKNSETLISTKDSSKEPCNKDSTSIIQKDNTTAKPGNTRISIKKPLESNKKLKKHPVSIEELRDNLVCLTQQQLEQILMAVKEATTGTSQLQDEKKEKRITSSADSNIPADQTTEENIMGLLQKAGEVPSVPSEHSFISNKNQGISKQAEQKAIARNSWKPADIFSALGERERDKTLLDAKKSQWKKELDEQIAFKKKLKETLETESKYHLRQKMDTVSCCFDKGQMTQEATPVEHPFSAVKREQQKKWLEELDKQKEADRLRKLEEKCNLSKGEEHDKWTMHFDSFRNHANSFSQYPLNTTYKKQPEIFQLLPEPQHQTAFTPTTSCHLTPSEVEISGKATGNISEPNQKASFLRSMTALLDPAQIEERGRRRQKQLEHQKAIMAQVEEKRKKKQLEEEQRKQEEQEEECRLAKEQELMKKQFEDDLLKQKQKEEIMTVKTNELYQTMQRAQELAQRLKQEQRIKDLAQKGHDISKLQKNIGGGDVPCESYCTDLNGFFDTHGNNDHCSGENSSLTNQDVKTILSPRKDTAVQTDIFNIDVLPNSEICTKQTGKGRADCESPGIAAEYKADFKSKKCKKETQYLDKKISEKENIVSYSNLYEQFAQKQKQGKAIERNWKKPDWNINKPCKRYIPASEKYPRCMQRQREEKKARRQMELLQLVERNSPGNLTQKKGISPDESPSLQHECDAKNKVSTLRNMIILYSKGKYCTPPFVSSMDFNNYLLQTLWTDVDRTVPNMVPDYCPSEHHLDHDHI